MCGIAGSVRLQVDAARVLSLLQHRGPDEQRTWKDDDVQLIFARLAIQELSAAGSQPMVHENLVIIFNGEIYNHRELRIKHGLKCVSHSDTETLLHLFRKVGTRMFSELDGMFAMAIYDRTARQLFLIRDRAGEKPLYYTAVNGHFFFGSELNVFRKLFDLQIDHQRVANFLSTGFLLKHQTPYKDVHELPGGHILTYDLTAGRFSIEQWWSIRDSYPPTVTASYEESIELVGSLLATSVERRMVSSDLEVGTFLSGGIDSGLVTALAARTVTKLKTFTVSFPGSYDEAPLAREVANRLGTDHQELKVDYDHLENDLERIILNYGEPVMDDSIIPSYYVSREARKHLTVILNGDAGDELFGGYRRYVPFASFNMWNSPLGNWSMPLVRSLPLPGDKMGAYSFFHRLVSLMSHKGIGVYLAATTDLLHDRRDFFLLPPDLKDYASALGVKEDLTSLQRIMLLDFEFLLHNVLLPKMDIATMANSLEGRSPFLSDQLLRVAPSLPDSFKIKGTTTKRLLRDLAKKYLPASVIGQPKRGFEVPLKDWVDSRLKDIIFDHLSPASGVYVKSILEPGAVDNLLDKRVRISPERRAKILFGLLATEIWKKG